jgi:zinc protease
MKRHGQLATAGAGMASFLILVLLAPAVRAEPSAKLATTTIEGITAYTLDNGLQVLLYPDPSSSRVTVNMTVLVGSRHEGLGETGMAHLLEHMLFKGTPKHPNVPKVLRDHGADYNGTTWLDRTNYYETMVASDANLEFGIRLEADRLVNSLVRREDLASEMTVVRNEFEIGENNTTGILTQRMKSAAFQWHNYGKSTIGNRSDIERVPIESLQAFYRKHYQPDNAVLVLAGKFDVEKARELIGRYFGPLKKPTRRLDKTYTEEPAQDGERQVVLRRVGKVGAVGALYHIPAAAHEDFAACEVLAYLLGYEPNGRLYKALVKTKKATRVSGTAEGCHDPGVLQVVVQTESKDEDALVALRTDMAEALEKLAGEKFTQEEVDRVKQKLLKHRALLMTDANSVGTELTEWVAKGDWRLFFLHRDRLEKVTPEDVSRVAERYLKRNNRTTGLYIPTQQPQRAAVPRTPNVAALVAGYKGRKAVAAGEAFDPTAETIARRVQQVTLGSGVKAALLPKKTRDEAVVVSLTLRFGNEESLKGHTAAAGLLGPLMRRGAAGQTRQQLDDALDKLKATVLFTSDAGEVSVAVQCKRESLGAVLGLAGKMLRAPSFPAEEFDVLKRQRLAGLARALSEPSALASRQLSRKLSPWPKDDVRYVATIEELIAQVKDLTVEKVRQLYQEQLGGQNGELVIVGDFDPEAATREVNEALDGWKSKTPYRRLAKKAFGQVKGERTSINTPDKESAIYLAGLVFALKDSDSDYLPLELGNYLLGGAGLSSRLAHRVRGKDGLSYNVGSTLNPSALDPRTGFLIYALFNPTNVDKADKAIAEELERFLKEGVTKKELDEGIKAYLQEQKNGRATDDSLAEQLAKELHAGRSFAFVAEQEKQIARLTPEQVQAAFARHIDPRRLVIVRAGDFRKKAAAPKPAGANDKSSAR